MSTLEHAAPSATEAPRPAVLVRVFQSVSIYLRALRSMHRFATDPGRG